MNKKIENLILLAVFFLLLAFNFNPEINEYKMKNLYERVNNHTGELADVDVYLYLAEKFSKFEFLDESGWNTTDGYVPNLQYKFPPLYSIILTPSFIFNIDKSLYIYSVSQIFSSLTFFPLFFFARRNFPFLPSLVTSLFPLFSLVFTWTMPWTVGVGIPFPVFLFFLATYFYYSYNQKFFFSSIFYSLMILTHYVAIYFLPLGILSIIILKRKKKKTIKNIIIFLSIPAFLLSLWLIRNAILHGISLTGLFGAYSPFFDRLFIYPDLIVSKLLSVYTFNMPIRGIYSLLLLFLLLAISPFFRENNKNLERFFYIFAFQSLFILIATGFMYRIEYINYKFLFMMTPLIIFVIFHNLFNILLDKLFRYKIKNHKEVIL